MDDIAALLESIARVGKQNVSHPTLGDIEPFHHFYKQDGSLDRAGLDRRDGTCTRRELLLRFLLLNAVLDQGPDIAGVRKLLADTTNALYRRGVLFLHTPIEFFHKIGLAIDQIQEIHQVVKGLRSATWGLENQTYPEKYNLFMDNSRQALNYAVFRWGVPLALPWLLVRDCPDEDDRPSALVDYLERWPSAEIMSQMLKDHERYGLGKAIGDKACHLFAKWMVSSFRLTRRTEPSWGDFSFEVPYDSNAGRVLWRTGYLLRWASEGDYMRQGVVQSGKGKGGLHYIRVTNIRGMGAVQRMPADLKTAYDEIALNHLKTHKRPPQKVEIQRIQHAYLLTNYQQSGLGVADFDEGLINIGTRYCFNHAKPECSQCPINQSCEGYQSNPRLIQEFRT